jgi:hypothetical protein
MDAENEKIEYCLLMNKTEEAAKMLNNKGES